DGDVKKIIDTYKLFVKGENAENEKFSHIAKLSEIEKNEYNLNIPRYIDTFEEEKIIDIEAVNTEIADIKVRILEIEKEMEKYLKELGL
ncbi:MAG: N-6 DNA methylase, partial [Oscillospiraceae bacterium]